MFLMCVWQNLKIIIFYHIKLATIFKWQPDYLLGENSHYNFHYNFRTTNVCHPILPDKVFHHHHGSILIVNLTGGMLHYLVHSWILLVCKPENWLYRLMPPVAQELGSWPNNPSLEFHNLKQLKCVEVD